MIEIDNVSFKYRQSEDYVFEKISFKATQGEFIGIIGPTGSGKSTLCYLFNGLIPHYFQGKLTGSVKINSKDIQEESVESMSEIIGYMLQEPSLQIASPFVESEITFGMENFQLPVDIMKQRLDSIVKKLGLVHLRERTTSELSEGEKQKVVLASILVMKPSILVLDECSSMVDTTSKNELAKILRDYNTLGNTIILIDHDLDFITNTTKRVLLINNGNIVADGPTRKIMTDSKLLRENGLVPPTLTNIFTKLKDKALAIDEIPIGIEESVEILGRWID